VIGKPTKQQIQEAMGWLSGISRECKRGPCSECPEKALCNHHDSILRTALEQYKPKTVSREWVNTASSELYEASINGRDSGQSWLAGRLVVLLEQDLGIEVVGENIT